MVKLIVFILISFSIGNTFGWFLRTNGRVEPKKDYFYRQTTKLQSTIGGLKSCAKRENTKLFDSVTKLIDEMVVNSKEIWDSFKWAMENDNFSNLGPEIVEQLKKFFDELFKKHSTTMVECLQKISESDKLLEILTLVFNYLKDILERSINFFEELGRILVCDNTNKTRDLLNDINSTLNRIETILDNKELEIVADNNFVKYVINIFDILEQLSKDMEIKMDEDDRYKLMMKKFIEIQSDMKTYLYNINDKTSEEVRQTLHKLVIVIKTDIFTIIAEEFEVFSFDTIETFLEELKVLEMHLTGIEPTPPPKRARDYMYDIKRIEDLGENITSALKKKGSRKFYEQTHTRIHMNYVLESLQNIVYLFKQEKKRLGNKVKSDDLNRILDDFFKISSDVFEHVTVKEGSEIDHTKVRSWIHEIKDVLARFGETAYDKDVNVPRSLYRGTFKRIYSALKTMYIDLKMTTDTDSIFNGAVENLNQLQAMTHCFESSLRLVDFKDETINSNVVSYFLKYADSLIDTLEENQELINNIKIYKLIQSVMEEIAKFLWFPSHNPSLGSLNDWILTNINTLNTLIQDFILAELNSPSKDVYDLLLRFILNLQDFKTNVERITIHRNASTPLLIHSIVDVNQGILNYMDKTPSDESVSRIISSENKRLRKKMSTFESAVRKMVTANQAIRIFGKKKPILTLKTTIDPAQFRRILRRDVDIFKRLTTIGNPKKLKKLSPYMVKYQNQLQDLKIRLVREFLKTRPLSEDVEEELKTRSSKGENTKSELEPEDQRKKFAMNGFLHMITKKTKAAAGGAKKFYHLKGHKHY